MRNRCCLGNVLADHIWEDAIIFRGHVIESTPGHPPRSSPGFFSTTNRRRFAIVCEAKCWQVGFPYEQRIWIGVCGTPLWLSIAIPFSPVYFLILLFCNTLIQKYYNRFLTVISRWVSDLEFPPRLRKTLYRKQDHASVSARGRLDTSPLPKKGKAEMPFLPFGPFYQVEASRSNRIDTCYNFENVHRAFLCP